MEINEEIKNNFVQLHNHTEFSVRDALTKVDELVEFAVSKNMKNLAVTDHGNIASWLRFYKACKVANIKPILGCEAYVNNYRYLSEEKDSLDEEQKQLYKKYNHLVIIAYNGVGIKNLIKINNDAHQNGFYYKPRTDFETLKKYNEGLIVTSACLGGEFPELIAKDKIKKAVELAMQYKSVFGDRYFIELQINNLEEQVKVNKMMIKIAKKLNIPLVVTNDCHYIYKEDNEIHDVLIAIRDRSSKSKDDSIDTQGYHARELYYKSYDEMYESWEILHKNEYFTEEIFFECIENVSKIVNKIEDVVFDSEVKLPKLYEDEETKFKEKIKEGIDKRYPGGISDEMKSRIKYEYTVIRKMNYMGYFLIIEDITTWAVKNDIAIGVGRGSISGSFISYLLGITNIDPIFHDLMFERFLDLGRDRIKMAKMI